MIKNLRIQKICSLVDGNCIAEIGCDHAYITKTLLENKKINFAYLTDISKKCLKKAVDNLKEFKDKTAFVVGDGLNAIKGIKNNENIPSINQIIIAGMGGQEIIKILQQDENNLYKNYILQPQRNVVEVRQYLQQNNFEILVDDLVQEGKMFYYVLKVQKSKKTKPLTLLETYFGTPTNKEVFKNYLMFELKKREEISKQKKIIENETLIRLIKESLQSL